MDVSMFDGSLVVARARGGQVPRRRRAAGARRASSSAGGLICYRPYACRDGWVTLGALEPKFWQAWCRGVGREDLVEKQFERPGSDAHAEVERIFLERTRDEWQAFASEHDCCLEPVLGLDEALDSELVRAREMVVELDQPGAESEVRLLGVPVKLSRTPGAPAGPGPALGEHTEEVLSSLGYSAEEIAALLESGEAAGPQRARRARFWRSSPGRSSACAPLVRDDGPDALLALHRLEGVVHLVERDAAGDERVEVEVA